VCSREQRVPNKDLVKLFIRAHALRSNSLVNSPWVVDENFVRKHSLPPVVYPSPQKVLGLCSLAAFTHTHTFNGPLSGTTRMSLYQKGKTNLDFTEARDSEWQWHQLGHMQVCTLLQTDSHIISPPLCFLQAG